MGYRLLATASIALAAATSAAAEPSRLHDGANAEVRQAIDAGNARYAAAFARMDPQAFADVYDADAVRLGDTSETSVTRGHAAIVESAARTMHAAAGPIRVTNDTQSLYVVDDLAYEAGRFTLTFTLAGDTQPRHVAGQYVTIWKKQKDGGWKIFADLPLPTA